MLLFLGQSLFLFNLSLAQRKQWETAELLAVNPAKIIQGYSMHINRRRGSFVREKQRCAWCCRLLHKAHATLFSSGYDNMVYNAIRHRFIMMSGEDEGVGFLPATFNFGVRDCPRGSG